MPYDRDGNFYEDDDPPDTGSGIPGDMGGSFETETPRPVQPYGGTASTPSFDPSGFHETEDIAELARKNPEDRAAYMQALNEKQTRRLASTNHRDYDSQGPAYNRTTNQLNPGYGPTRPTSTGPGVSPAFSNTAPLFDDPASRLLEDYAMDRFQQRQNPDPNSGTALFEQYARELMETLKQPVYSPQDEDVIKTKAIDSIEKERSATKSRWMQEISQRRMAPSSGVALEGLLKIEDHFNTARTVFEREFASDAIQQTRLQRVQRLNTAGELAGSEEGRLREALTYASIPKQLQDNSFQQGLQLVGAGGNPQSILNSALSIANSAQNADAYRSQNRAAQMSGLMQYIGYLFS